MEVSGNCYQLAVGSLLRSRELYDFIYTSVAILARVDDYATV